MTLEPAMNHLSPFKIMSLLLPVMLSACGGGVNGTESKGALGNYVGQFIDSPVQGLNYLTASGQGITNANGEFNYQQGESVTFSIGDITLPQVSAAAIITPLTLANTSDYNHIQVVNIARLLQTLDTDGDPSNGITIDDQAHSAASGLSLSFDETDFDDKVANLVANAGSVNSALIASSDAISHLQDSLGEESECGNSHPMVGASLTLSSRAHSVNGTVRIVDNCTLEIRNFSYDGGGPNVYVYGAVDGDYINGFAMGNKLTGTRFNNQTLTITLNDETVLDNFNSLSIWCVDFDVSFGDGIFQSP